MVTRHEAPSLPLLSASPGGQCLTTECLSRPLCSAQTVQAAWEKRRPQGSEPGPRLSHGPAVYKLCRLGAAPTSCEVRVREFAQSTGRSRHLLQAHRTEVGSFCYRCSSHGDFLRRCRRRQRDRHRPGRWVWRGRGRPGSSCWPERGEQAAVTHLGTRHDSPRHLRE